MTVRSQRPNDSDS